MNIATKPIPKLIELDAERYISPEYAQKEKEKLWPRVWQVACREEEIPAAGDYVVYEMADEAYIVARAKSGAIVAYHNVCPHRGRRLAKGCGRASQFRCGYHGWTFDLEGRNILVQDKEDWAGSLDDVDLNLKKVRVDSWGGFVFIDPRAEGESLQEYLGDVIPNLGPFEYEKMQYRWYVTVHLDCNWKVALEAFIEGYHVAATHPQLLHIFGDDYTNSYARGKHSIFTYERQQAPLTTPSPRLNMPTPEDGRPAAMEFFEIYEDSLKAMFTERDYAASKQLMQVLPEKVDAMTAFGTAVELGRAAAIADGVGYPEGVTYEHLAKAGADWHIFPNFVTLPWFDGALCYRARPDPANPDKCFYDISSLVRYAPGKAPPLERKVILDPTVESVSGILDQDIANMAEVQKGMKSSVFRKCKPNPIQEVPVINFHHNLDQYLEG